MLEVSEKFQRYKIPIYQIVEHELLHTMKRAASDDLLHLSSSPSDEPLQSSTTTTATAAASSGATAVSSDAGVSAGGTYKSNFCV